MSETALAVLLTVLVLLALAAWVPLLHLTETQITRLTERGAIPSPEEEEGAEAREAA